MFTGVGGASPVAFIPFKGWVTETIFHQGKGPGFTSCSTVGEIDSSTYSKSLTNYRRGEQKECVEKEEGGSECINEDCMNSMNSVNSIPANNSSALGRTSGSGITDTNNNNNNTSPTEELYKRAEMGKLQSSKYKGVVPQPNGRWGAQIYEKHQRVWLGTYNTEEAAARSYDRAAFKFRLRDAVTNFASLHDADPEAVFILRHSKSEIVDMLRKHTFEDEFQHYIRESSPNATGSSSFSDSGPPQALRTSHPEHLFDKTMTPSDVGKLNRLVIPKQYAEKYFSLGDTAAGKSVLLNFHDCGRKTWRFRYTYWNSSQSFVFTKGWNRYVKENGLQVGDIVRFERTTVTSGQLYISFRHRISSGFHTDALKPAVPMSYLLSSPSQLCISQRSLTCDTLNGFPGNSCLQFGHTSLCFEALKCCLVNGSNRSASLDGNSSCVESKSLVRQISVSSSCSSRGVMVFGANLSQSLPPATLNLFPGIKVEEEQYKDCERLQQERKRKWEGPFGFYDGKKQVHNGL